MPETKTANLWTKYSVFILCLLFVFRLAYGLCCEFWFEDERQIYLIGLIYFTTGHWPYFGPDVVYTATQIPGALQGLLVGLPLHIWPIPEAPYLLLNMLSFFSLLFLGWYIKIRLPQLPQWFIYFWLLLAPWTLNFSAHINNPSYVLTGAVLFIIAIFETYPQLTKNRLPRPLCFFMLGFSLLWIFQLHMSYILLLPYIGLAFLFNLKYGFKNILIAGVFFLLGALVSGSTLLPTIIKFGLFSSAGTTQSNIVFNPKHLLELPAVFTKFISFASFELPRFIGGDPAKRMDFVYRNLWSVPFLFITGITGLVQAISLLVLFFKKSALADWKKVKYFTLITVLLIYISFTFSVKNPVAHAFYFSLPLAMIYAFYCWESFLQKKWMQKFLPVFFAAALFTHIAIASDNYKRKSMYVDRDIPAKAIIEKNYTILGKRRYE